MNKNFSLYLDATRFLAAVFVVLSHFHTYALFNKGTAALVPELGREAVMVFFVLSGYVIAHTVADKRQTLRDYVVARCGRIYSVALPVLLAAFAMKYLDEVWFFPGSPLSYQLAKAYLYLPLHGFFLGERWNISETPPWLVPYWSLGYEAWYYVFFAVVFYLTGWARVLVGTVVFMVLGPKAWLLLPVWFAGVLLHRQQINTTLTVRTARLLWCLSIVLIVSLKYFDLSESLRLLGEHIWPFPSLKLGSSSRYLSDYLVCLFIVLNFHGARSANFSMLERFGPTIRAVSSCTFTLYLVHMLVIMEWLRWVKHDSTGMTDLLCLSALIAFFTYGVAAVTEHRKAWFAGVFGQIFDQLQRRLQWRSRGLPSSRF